tara:strand:+ start:41 stop:739 length:699 start_codon:yes stop_codon:yes gene_type:complete
MSGATFPSNNFRVFLELQRRNDGYNMGQQNRIPLFVESLNMSTTKTVMNVGIPFSGAVTGESQRLAFDMGMATKTVNLSGVLLEQTIVKKNSSTEKSRILTAYEMAQLIHSYADSSTFQDDQNLNKLIILMPSRVDEDFEYHTASDETNDIEDLPLIPFSWKNREYDNSFTAFTGKNKKWFTPYDNTADVTVGMEGFIRSFTTDFMGTDMNSVGFTLDFEEAHVLNDNFLDG